jgi:hypothetical protein
VRGPGEVHDSVNAVERATPIGIGSNVAECVFSWRMPGDSSHCEGLAQRSLQARTNEAGSASEQ